MKHTEMKKTLKEEKCISKLQKAKLHLELC